MLKLHNARNQAELRDAPAKVRKDTARMGPRAKNAKSLPAREFVKAAWEKDKAGYKSKSDFALIHAGLVKRTFGIDVRPRTIADDWLPKG